MKCIILHSLQHTATVKIATGVFYDSEIEKMLQEHAKYPRVVMAIKFNRDLHELWKLIQIKVSEKLPCLPDSLQTKVCNYIQALQVESQDWIKDHKTLLELDSSNCLLVCKKDFCWKSDGTINRVETAKKIVQNKEIDPNTRFILACNYFLEDEILAIWPEVNKKSLRRNSAVRFWLKWLRKRPVTPWRLMVDDYFRIPCFRRSDIPLRLSSFFPYLSQESLVTYLKHIAYDLFFQSFDKDEFFSCLCEMNEDIRTKFLQLIPGSAISYCLKWPYQSLFIEMASQLESCEKDYDIERIFLEIVSCIVYGLHDFDYAGLLREFWNVSPSLKKEIKEIKIYSRVMKAILNYDEDKQSLTLGEIVDKCLHEKNNLFLKY